MKIIETKGGAYTCVFCFEHIESNHAIWGDNSYHFKCYPKQKLVNVLKWGIEKIVGRKVYLEY